MESLGEMAVHYSKGKIPLGTLLLVDELILPQDLDLALEHQKHSKLLVGEILVRLGALERPDLDRTLKLQNRTFSQ